MKGFELLNFPIFLKHISGKSYLKLNSATLYVSLFIQDVGEEYRYELVRTSCPMDRLYSIYESKDFVKCEEKDFMEQMKKYVAFNEKLKNQLR